MKKLYTGIAALIVAAFGANAQTTFNNPTEVVDGETYYIVKWDSETNSFAKSNDWEIDETFIFAIDVKGTSLETKLAEPSRNNAVLGRSLAYDIYPTNGPEEATGVNVDGRLFHITGTVYGMTVNFFQQHTSRFKDGGLWPNEDFTEYKATTEGEVVVYNANIFGFGWSVDNPGMEWWDAIDTPIQGEFPFICAPYTGTKTSPLFTFGDVIAEDECPFEGMDPGALHSMCDSWGGYATPEAFDAATSGVSDIAVESDSPVVASEYYNIQGQRIATAPQKGLYIVKSVKADGSSVVSKVVR